MSVLPARAQQTIRSITVEGIGRASSAPDLVSITLGAETISTNLDDAVAQIRTRIAAITSAMIELGVFPYDMQASGIDVQPQDLLDSRSGGVSGQLVYRVRGTLSVIMRDIGQIEELLNSAVTAGANIIGEFRYGVTAITALEAAARTAAIESARDRATQLAAGLGLTVGVPLTVEEILIERAFPTAENPGAGSATVGLDRTTTNAGQLIVTVQIRVTFRVQ
jgi:uncharacterized protein YggE